MTVNSPEYIHSYANHMAPVSQRQIPAFSQMGKGLRGDSFEILLNSNGQSSQLEGKYYNQMTEEESTIWTLPLSDLVPQMHYKIYEGVREIDGVNMWVYYIEYTYTLTMQGETATLANFVTPYTQRYPFNGTTIPVDTVIEQG